jgi:uncharacterized phage protein gp47/JayE
MAQGLPTPKSRQQILSEMLTEYVGLTGVNDLNTGSVMTQFFDVVARSVARTSGDIFQILRDFSLDRATGEALNRIGTEERVNRRTAQVATGKVKVTDTSFEKISTKIYTGSPAPNIGSIVIRVADASKFPNSGRIYIGRGTTNIEGPIDYVSKAQVGAYWEITLDSPTKKFHNISESIVLGQGGTRNIPAGTVVLSPGAGAAPSINYTVTSSAILLDGENVNENVSVVAQEPGSSGNAPIGAITRFVTAPFPNAKVINTIPFSTGLDSESDDDYRDRIKKTRLSRGLGTALAVKNAVLGAQASDENARVTSNEIDTANPEQTILYIDNGSGYEEKTQGIGLEFIVDSAIGGEQTFQLTTGGRQTSVAKAFLESSESAPFTINTFDKLAILVGGIISEHTFLEGDFRSSGSVTAYEVVASINNNPTLTFQASTSADGTKVVIQAKTEENEFLQLTAPAVGVDAGPKLGFPLNEVDTVLLYKNGQLLSKNGRSAFVLTKDKFEWSNSITNGDTLIVSVDGTAAITYTFLNQDFIAEGQHTIVSPQNSLSSWVNVFNNKLTGITAEVNGEQIKLTSNLGPSGRASLDILPTSTLVQKGMFSEQLGLSSQGSESEFQLSRNTAQIKLKQPLSKGDSLNLGSEFTRAEIQSQPILGGQTTISEDAYLWLVVDELNAQPVEIGVTADGFLDVLKPGNKIVRYESTSPNAFSNVEVGDYVIIWSKEVSAGNRLEARVYDCDSNFIELKVTAAEESLAVAEGPILYKEGITVIRSKVAPQKLKVAPGVYNINSIANIMNSQLTNASVSVKDDELFIIRTNTEKADGSLFIADFNDPAKALNFIKNSQTKGINSQIAFYESNFQDKQFPLFVHGKVVQDRYADPIDSYIVELESDENLSDLEPSGFIAMAQPYNAPDDIVSPEAVEIEFIDGTTVFVEQNVFNKRNREDDRYYVLSGYDFGHEDKLVCVLNNDPNGQTFDIPLYRTAKTSNLHPNNPDNFRALDVEGGDVEFTQFFGNSFLFDNYKVLMRAKNVIDPQSLANEDAILYRSVEWGRSGEKVRVGYKYPTSADQEISHVVRVFETVDISIFIKSGPSRSVVFDGTTEWNVIVSPLDANSEYVTYAYSGTGTSPDLTSINAGDYVSIINTGEFEIQNTGSFKVDSATITSFTTIRKIGEAIPQSDVATLDTNTLDFFEPSDTTAQEIVDYVNEFVSDYLEASIIEDNGLSGAGIVDTSTLQDSGFVNEYVQLVDGKNFIFSTDLDALVGNPQFVFKTPLQLPSYSTNTVDAYSFNDGEELKLIPITSIQLSQFLNVLAVTGITTLGKIKSVNRNNNIQISTDTLGSAGAVQIAGGSGNTSSALILGSASTLGIQGQESSVVSINKASAGGFHSDQWIKVSASAKQRKLTLVSPLNSIRVYNNTPNAGFAKIELFNKENGQRFFGRNRYHTRTRGRTFKVEKQGMFTCVSWDGQGVEPYFLKNNIEINDSSAYTVTIYKDQIRGTVDISVDTGDTRFDEVDIGDLLTISNRVNAINNGDFLVIGKSEDGKTVKILNPQGINELVSGNFTILDNTDVLGNIFTVGTIDLEEGVDFVAGVDEEETAYNLAAAISLLPNIIATSDTNIVYIESQVPQVSIPITVSGIGATASGAELVAPLANSGDLIFKSEVQEGDSAIFGAPFDILNQGVYRVIRRFKNSVYIDNPNTVEQEITLSDNPLNLGYDGTSNFDIAKIDDIARLSWGGAGAEANLELARPGDTITLGSDFSANNQGEFHVINAGQKLKQITSFKQSRGVDMVTGQHALINAADGTEFYFYYDIDNGGGDPGLVGKTAIQIEVDAIDTAEQIAIKKANVFNNSPFNTYFVATVVGDTVTITNVGYGPTVAAENVTVTGPFTITTLQEGRFNFVDYINVMAEDESSITISDILEIHQEAIKFKDYDGTTVNDIFAITGDFLGDNNIGNRRIVDILSDSALIVTGNMVSTEQVLLDNNFNAFYVEEEKAYVGYKNISLIASNPANLNNKNIVFDTSAQYQKISQLSGSSIQAISKFKFPEQIVRGVDSYKYNTGLIAEANRIVYGDPRDNTTYPGVSAAGSEIFIKAPLVRRVEVSIDVRVKTGVPFSVIVEEVRSSVAALINSNPVGQAIAISNIVSTVDSIIGVQAVAISSPQYSAENDVIRVNSGEKALVLDIVSDIIVSKID